MKIRDCFVASLLAMTLNPSLVWAATGSNDFQLTSSAFEDNAVIPSKYTCDGSDVNPPLSFKNVPSNAKSLVLTVSDPDAPMGRWSHWVIYNIPPGTQEITENTSPGTEGINDFGKNAYGGPCPPGHTPHHYIFHAYALDALLTVNEGATINEVEKALEDHIIAQTQLIGTYQK
jgi:Raf kinase inhibitor-like YbhB/YbcL family protein